VLLRARDNLDLCRDFIDLRDARTVRLRDLAADDRRDPVLFAVLARKPPPAGFARLRQGLFRRQDQILEQAEQFEHDYDDDNYSDYVEDVSVHAED
jgi:hypothetical protein